MIQLELIKKFYPQHIQDNAVFNKFALKEYLQLLILDYLSASQYIRKITFIGGTNLRLVKGIDRFSEDLDFDCNDLSKKEFTEMTDSVLRLLINNGFRVTIKDKETDKLQAFRRSFLFPEFLFDLELTGHREERFLIKIESQDQQIVYQPVITNIKACGFFFPFPVPPDDVLCAMKISAMLSRQKGRDFYDLLWFMQQRIQPLEEKLEKDGIQPYDIKSAMLALQDNIEQIKPKDLSIDLLPLFEKRACTEAWIDSFHENFNRFVRYYL